MDPIYHVDQAEVLVTLGSDFLGGGQTGLREEVGFGAQRRLKGHGKDATMGQIIAFEPALTQIGSCADIRTRVDMDDMLAVGWAIAEKVAEKLGATLPAAGAAAAKKAPELEKHPGVEFKKYASIIDYTAAQLLAAKQAGKHSLVYVGGATHTGGNSAQLYVVANYLNHLLGNEGVTVETASAPEFAATTSASDFAQLLTDLNAGTIKTLIVAGANPAFDWHDAAAVATAFGKATVVSLCDRNDETTQLADFVAPARHDLESWGDAELLRGLYAVQQPCTFPLWDNREVEQSLMAFALAAEKRQLHGAKNHKKLQSSCLGLAASHCGRQPLKA